MMSSMSQYIITATTRLTSTLEYGRTAKVYRQGTTAAMFKLLAIVHTFWQKLTHHRLWMSDNDRRSEFSSWLLQIKSINMISLLLMSFRFYSKCVKICSIRSASTFRLDDFLKSFLDSSDSVSAVVLR